MSCWIAISIYYEFCLSSAPFLGIFAGGFYYVGFSSLRALHEMHKEREAIVIAAVEPIST
jgi:hypothetical protein